MTVGLDRLKILINSSTPIVVMETSEETHAVSVVRTACNELNMATFEWSIADGLVRSGSNAPAETPVARMSPAHPDPTTTVWNQNSRGLAQPHNALTPGGTEAERLARAVMSSMGTDAAAAAT